MTDYRDWIGSREVREDYASLSTCQRMAATLDDTDTVLKEGDGVPPMWHWCFFLPDAPMREIGPDGHPKRGGFLPPIAAPRRMFAGSVMEFHAPLPIGSSIRREGEVTAIEEKSGKTGNLIFVTVVYRFFAGDRLCLEETQTVVYRELGAPNPAPVPLQAWPDLPEGSLSRIVHPDPVSLMRYSALTFNGHRIHYDRPYTLEEEGYPGLLVQGPFIATYMSELVRKNVDRPIKRISFRAIAPVFDTNDFRVVANGEGNLYQTRAERIDGQVAQKAEIELA